MRRYLLSPVLIMLSMLSVSYALAETATLPEVIAEPDANLGSWFLKMFLFALTMGGSAVTPYITKYLTMWILMGVGKANVTVPAPILIFISTIISGVWAGVMGAETSLPLHGDTTALIGSIVGGGSQHFANSAPVTPSPAAMAKMAAPKEETANV